MEVEFGILCFNYINEYRIYNKKLVLQQYDLSVSINFGCWLNIKKKKEEREKNGTDNFVKPHPFFFVAPLPYAK